MGLLLVMEKSRFGELLLLEVLLTSSKWQKKKQQEDERIRGRIDSLSGVSSGSKIFDIYQLQKTERK